MVLESWLSCKQCFDKGSPCMAHDGVPGNWSPPPILPVEVLEDLLLGWDWVWLSPDSIMYWTPSGCH